MSSESPGPCCSSNTRRRSMGCSPQFWRKRYDERQTHDDSSYELSKFCEPPHGSIVGEYCEEATSSSASELAMSPRSKAKRLWKSISPFVSPFHSSHRKLKDVPAEERPVKVEKVRVQANVGEEQTKNVNTEGSATHITDYSLHFVTFLVKIRLKEGTGLAIRDASGSSDPYVKFLHKDRIVYKSQTIFKNLNPVWDEEFSMLIDDITTPINIEVFDYDRFCADDFMGATAIDLSQLKLFQSQEFRRNITLDDFDEAMELVLTLEAPPGTEGCSEDEELGSISLTISITPQTQEEKEIFLQKSSRGILSAQEIKSQRLVQEWASVVSIILVEARGIMPSSSGPPDVYCKFKLGQEKYKSKVCSRTLEPKWLEQFYLHIYEGSTESLQVSCLDRRNGTLIGSTNINLQELERERTIQQWYPVYVDDEPSGATVLLLIPASHVITGNAKIRYRQLRYMFTNSQDLLRTGDNLAEVGQLNVKVFRAEGLAAADIGGKSDPFCVVELVNTRLQTHTEYKTLSPHWNKLFSFVVRDIHCCLEVTIFDEDQNNKFEFLGKVAIPLFAIRNCEKRWYALKDKKLQNRAKGEILMELDIIWNPVRAAIRTFNPREKKYMAQQQKFKAALFRNTVMQLKDIALSVIEYKDYVYSCFDWESKTRSSIAFTIFVLTVYHFEIHHAPVFLILLFLKGYIYKKVRDGVSRQRSVERISSGNDSDTEESTPRAKNQSQEQSSSIKDTLFSVQETLQVVQSVLVFIHELLQRIKNAFNFSCPWLSCLAVIVLAIATVLLYMVPLRWIIMIWGINKFTKRLRNPHYIDNNELLDYLSRVPSDTEIQQWKEFPVNLSEKKASTKVKER